MDIIIQSAQGMFGREFEGGGGGGLPNFNINVKKKK